MLGMHDSCMLGMPLNAGPLEHYIQRFASYTYTRTYISYQEMDLMLIGDVLGFNGGPAGYRHSVIMRRNITICGTDEFVAGTCTPGTCISSVCLSAFRLSVCVRIFWHWLFVVCVYVLAGSGVCVCVYVCMLCGVPLCLSVCCPSVCLLSVCLSACLCIFKA